MVAILFRPHRICWFYSWFLAQKIKYALVLFGLHDCLYIFLFMNLIGYGLFCCVLGAGSCRIFLIKKSQLSENSLTHCGLVMPYGPTDLRRTLDQVMAWCLMAPSRYLNQCWLIIKGVLLLTCGQFHQKNCSWTYFMTCIGRLYFKNPCHISQGPMS